MYPFQMKKTYFSSRNIKCTLLLVSTYVVCERLSVMHKQVSGWTVNFCPNSPDSPLSGEFGQKFTVQPESITDNLSHTTYVETNNKVHQFFSSRNIKCTLLLVSTYVVCERLSVMHKQVSGWTVNFCPNSPDSPFLEFQTKKAPPPTFRKTSDLRWPKFTLKYPPISENFRFEMTKVYSEIPPNFRKLQIWDDQSLLRNTPPLPVVLQSGRSHVETNL